MMATVATAVVTSFPGEVVPEWPEPIQRVQSLASSGLKDLPAQFIRPAWERPSSLDIVSEELELIPTIDLTGIEDDGRRKMTLAEIENACEEWGFFQIVNHDIPPSLLRRVRMVARQFFELPVEEKQVYANNPSTYEGYGSRVGVEKAAILDWGDYFYLNVLPENTRDIKKWPSNPVLWRETMEEYSQQVQMLSQKLLAAISCTLDLASTSLKDAFGGDEGYALALRVNFYPPCPQPALTLGLSSHTDPGGMTIVLQDDDSAGLQIRHDGRWIAVNPLPGGLVVNLGDQLQIMTNGRYKSVDHRVVANHKKDRLSIVAFCNPGNQLVVGPLDELTDAANPPRYKSMTFREYRSFIRRTGNKGKEILESVSSLSL